MSQLSSSGDHLWNIFQKTSYFDGFQVLFVDFELAEITVNQLKCTRQTSARCNVHSCLISLGFYTVWYILDIEML